MSWLPEDFEPPARVDLRSGHHLRPIHPFDTDLDYPAVMGSRERLWSIYGGAWGWPPSTMTSEEDRTDLARHEVEAEWHRSFNYALFDAHESALLGCVYIDPPERIGADAEISWWVIDSLVDSELAGELGILVPRWIAEAWPFERPRYVGRDLTWEAWLQLPEVGEA